MAVYTVDNTLRDESDGNFGTGATAPRSGAASDNASPGTDTITFAPARSGGTIHPTRVNWR
jgi:hypothetical protein